MEVVMERKTPQRNEKKQWQRPQIRRKPVSETLGPANTGADGNGKS
jgi:hypothetical protein